MTQKLQYLIILFCLSFGLYAQDMQKGFTYLETGQYKAAETFFAEILKVHPDNKTARLCYGRAIGLNGKPEMASEIFSTLLKDYPSDFEIELNYGEALLWNRKFVEAKTYYESLIAKDAQSFPALLGYANTLSNLKLYADALSYVNKALMVSPDNPNALTSKKYIYLGYAYQNQQAQQYVEAETLLLEGLYLFENDKDLLLNLANLYLIMDATDKAKATYERLSELPQYQMEALNGLALVAHLKGKEGTALKLSTQAYDRIVKTTAPQLKQQTTERYVQALIWHRKYKKAQALIDSLITTDPKASWILALRATLNIYKSDFEESLKDYESILSTDSTSFDGNLGKANALNALGRYRAAYTGAERTLEFYSNQKDALYFIQQLDTRFSPFTDTKASYTFDNGDNKAYAFNTSVAVPLSTRFTLNGVYGYRSTKNTATNAEATSNEFQVGMTYQWLPQLALNAKLGLVNASADTNDYTQLLTNISLNIKPFKLQSLVLGYQRELQNFNADLLDREIVMHNFYANYNLNTNCNLGWFTQYYFTSQNDDNTRHLLFTSLYYTFMNQPVLKGGINYQHITFKDQVPEFYFSPERFNAVEVFANLIRDERSVKVKSWYYNATAAFGYQFIENNDSQSTYRFQGALGYKFSERSLLNVYGTHSNIASATAAGFRFTELGLRFKWYLTGKPIFTR